MAGLAGIHPCQLSPQQVWEPVTVFDIDSPKIDMFLREGFKNKKKELVEFSTKRGGEGVRIGQFSTKKNIG